MNKNRAFTLAETLVTLGIVGVLVVVSMSFAAKKVNQQIFQGYKAAYSMLSETCNDIKDNLKGNIDLTSKWGLTPDGFVKSTGNSIFMENPTRAGLFCEILSDYMNIVKSNCENPIIPFNATTIADNQFHIILSNSMRIAISKNVVLPINANGIDKVLFRIIFVDVNGKNGEPNTITNETDAANKVVQPADIIPFAILTDGKVVPIGIPATDFQYITSKILYPPFITDSSGNSVQNEREMSQITSFSNSKCKAWGDKLDPLDPLSYDYASALTKANGTFLKGYNKPACNIQKDIDKKYGCTTAPSKCYIVLQRE